MHSEIIKLLYYTRGIKRNSIWDILIHGIDCPIMLYCGYARPRIVTDTIAFYGNVGLRKYVTTENVLPLDSHKNTFVMYIFFINNHIVKNRCKFEYMIVYYTIV